MKMWFGESMHGVRLPKIYRFRRTTLMASGFIAIVVGIAIAKTGIHFQSYWLIVGAVITVCVLLKRKIVALLAVICLGFMVGLWRGQVVQQQLVPYTKIYDKKVVLRVTAITDSIYATQGQLSFDGSQVEIVTPFAASVPGVISVRGLGESAVFKGDIVQVEGKLQTTLGSKQGRMSFAKLSVRSHRKSIVDDIRRNFGAGIQSALPEPLASFGLGLLIGQRSTLPKATTDQLSTVGLSHIVAVSGYNLTILIEAVRRFIGKRSKYQSTLLSILLVVGFLLVTGLSASIVRAAIVSLLGLWAWYYGRKFRPIVLISLAAAVTGLWNPMYVWGDIGWYLSFAAFFGVLVVAPLAVRRIYSKKREPRALTMVFIESICAQIMTAPIILYIFHQTSLIALVSNVVLVPLVPLGMLLTFVAGLAGMFIESVAGWFAWPARILLTYMLEAVALLSRIPHALVGRTISLATLIISFGLILGIIALLWHRTKSQSAILTEIEMEQ